MSNWNFGDFGFADGAGDEDEDAEVGFSWKAAGRDSIIFLVDVTRPMFIKQETGESHFELCMKCAQSVLKNKIISSDRDLVGVIFFGTDKEKNSGNFKHIYTLQELDQPCAARILELESFTEDGTADFEQKYGHNSSFSLSDALWACSNMFSQSPHNLASKRVLLFTCNDNPHSNDPALQRQARTKAKDLHEVNIDIELLHLTTPGKEFNFSEFYQDIVFNTDEDEASVLPDASEKLEELMTRVRAKDNKKRTMGRIGFELGEGLQLGVAIYNLIGEQKKPYPTKLYKRTNEPLKRNRKTFCEDTGELLMQTDIKKYQVYGGRKIVFEQEEVADIKKFGDSGLKLMGFKPRTALKPYLHVRPAQFIFPDETSIQGSTTLFNALLKKCLARDVVAICRFIPRRNSPPRFVALLAQDEELDDQSIQISPPGFHVIFLPFADDIRKLQYPEAPRATPDQIDKAKTFIKKLSFPFSSENFENPVLQTHYRTLEALALDKDLPDAVVDHTEPPQIDKRVGGPIQEFMDMVFPQGYVPGAKPPPKRKAESKAGGAAKKPAKDGGNVDMEDMARQGKLAKLTVPVLKEFCQSKGLSTGGKKNDLVEEIKSFFGV